MNKIKLLVALIILFFSASCNEPIPTIKQGKNLFIIKEKRIVNDTNGEYMYLIKGNIDSNLKWKFISNLDFNMNDTVVIFNRHF